MKEIFKVLLMMGYFLLLDVFFRALFDFGGFSGEEVLLCALTTRWCSYVDKGKSNETN